jgi:1-acyl-sn-glycerol-3-phosphate acyltransferase
LHRLSQIAIRTTHYIRLLFRNEKKMGHIDTALAQKCISEWSAEMLSILRVEVSVKGTPTKEAAIFIGNHISYIDIPLIMSCVPVVFVAKKQISKWPVFGAACRSVGCIFVDRDSRNSRSDAASLIAPCIHQRKVSLAIFPSGTTLMDESKAWKRGVFKIAHENNIPLQPFRVRYQPPRRAAYLQEDHFVTHLWNVLDNDGLKASIEFHPPIYVENPDKDCEKWWKWSREGLGY